MPSADAAPAPTQVPPTATSSVAPEPTPSVPTVTLGPAPAAPPTVYPAAPAPPPRPVERRWYGWQTLSVDIGLGIAAGAAHDSNDNAGRRVAAIAFTLGAPTVHAFHGHWGKASASVLLHLPGALLIAQEKPDCSGCLGLDSNTLFLGLVDLLGVAIDSIVLANEDVPPETRERAGLWVNPWVSPRGDAGIGIGGSYY